MLNSMAAKLRHKSLCVKDLIVKFCLQKLQNMARNIKKINIFYALLGDWFVPFPLMENEPKRSSAIRSSDRRLARATAPRSDVGAKPRLKQLSV